jgi:hypothetical protein
MKLLQYIRGNRKGKEINRLEKEAMRDHFLADALDGFDKVKSNEHELRINEMRKMILSRTKSGNSRILRYLSIAASILLIIGSGWYFLSNKVVPPVSEQRIVESSKESISGNISQEFSFSETKIQADTVLTAKKEIDNKKINKPAIKARTRNDNNNKAKRTDTVIIPDTALMIENEILAEVMDKDETVSVEAGKSRVEGIIRDAEGNPLPGASIIYRDSNVGTTSDVNGYFELPKSKEKNIQVSLIGYKQANIVANTDGKIGVIMEEDDIALAEEVVVVAFGTQKKLFVTGAATDVPVNSLNIPQQDLSSRMAGAVIVPRQDLSSRMTSAASQVKGEKPKPVIGEKEYKKYLKANAIMPQSDDCKKKKGKVTLIFTINSKGRPKNIRIKKSLCPTANSEAIRLIEQGPDWTTGNKEVELKIKFK